MVLRPCSHSSAGKKPRLPTMTPSVFMQRSLRVAVVRRTRYGARRRASSFYADAEAETFRSYSLIEPITTPEMKCFCRKG